MKDTITKINRKGISAVNGLALVSNTSYEVVFYGMINGKLVQSNNMIEEGLVDSLFLESIYEEIVGCVKKSANYNSEKLNIVTFNDNGIVSFKNQDRACSLFSIKKEWKKTVIG